MTNRLTYIFTLLLLLFLSTNCINSSVKLDTSFAVKHSDATVVLSNEQNNFITLNEASLPTFDLEENSEVKDFGNLNSFNPLFIASQIKNTVEACPKPSLVPLFQPFSKQYILTFTLRI